MSEAPNMSACLCARRAATHGTADCRNLCSNRQASLYALAFSAAVAILLCFCAE
jgi:hydrogenase/urease accessory protein HupE